MDPLTFTDEQLVAALRTFEQDTTAPVWALVNMRAMEIELRNRREQDDA